MVLFTITGAQVVPTVDMSPYQTIRDLKEKIEQELGVCMHRQDLWCQGYKLVNDACVWEYGFRAPTTLNLTVERLQQDLKIHVLVKCMGDDGYVRVKESHTVSDLKRKVARYWSIPADQFTLRRLNVEMKDNDPLHEYYVNEATDVVLSLVNPAPQVGFTVD